MPRCRPKIRGHKRSCADKQRFKTQDEARSAAYHGYKGRFNFMMAYKCGKCKKWHYGHPTKPEHWKAGVY